MSLTTFTIKKVKELGVTLSTASKIPFKDPEAYGGNLLKLKDGAKQRFNIVPKDASLEANTKRIGFYQPNMPQTGLDPTNLWIHDQ
mmetsp:Transcript_24217/g.21324  ORF Transcript_24217/g.21324 Transcript_24217/m.21324 type:complete len:86 (+) Transcript_24217:20-277(+)